MVAGKKRACPICKSLNSSVFMKENAYNNRDHIQLLRCTDCGFVFSKSAYIDYSSFGKSASLKTPAELVKDSASQGIPDLVSEIINKTGINQGKILDFGCGVGLFLRNFKKKHYDVLGVEDSDAFRAMLGKVAISSVSDLSEIKDLRGHFDIVIIKDVVEHLEYPLDILNNVISFIKPGGFLYLRVPNRYAYPFHWAVDTKGHINHFTPREVKKILKTAGLNYYDSVKVHDVSSRAGKLYNFVFWNLRYVFPMTHQISFLYKKKG